PGQSETPCVLLFCSVIVRLRVHAPRTLCVERDSPSPPLLIPWTCSSSNPLSYSHQATPGWPGLRRIVRRGWGMDGSLSCAQVVQGSAARSPTCFRSWEGFYALGFLGALAMYNADLPRPPRQGLEGGAIRA
uniref:Uncharacterized protein n=1 Tax=Chelydra serpentina TaxID=8475 RepID=A0A8C3SM13_CHESE